jgi:hypothetical protein
MIYTGNLAKRLLTVNLNDRDNAISKGYFKDGDYWISFDNSTGGCYVEEFQKEKHAIAWLENYFEVSEFEDFKIYKIVKSLYYIKGVGWLKIRFGENSLKTKLYKLLVFY